VAIRFGICRPFFIWSNMKKITERTMNEMKQLGGLDYARQEAWDIANAAQALSQIAYMTQNEIEEPADVQSLANIMRGLLEFIGGEITEMVGAARQGDVETKTASITIADNPNLNLSYVKSLGIEKLPELAVKFVAKDEIKGYSVMYGDPNKVDLEREYFTKDTNFWDQQPVWLTWDHAQDEEFKSDPRIGNILETGEDEWGRWYVARLKKSEAYRKYLDMMISEKRLGSSSDSAPQYVERVKTGKAVWLKTWPLFAVSLTDNPCEPRMIGSLEYLKSLVNKLPDTLVKDEKAWLHDAMTVELLKAKY
jgi:hypothetical protein